MHSCKILFRKSRVSWRITWILSSIISILSIYFQNSIFFLNFYLYFAGLVAFYISLGKYAVLDEEGIELQVGPIFRKKILKINWEKIDSFVYTKIEREWITKTRGVDDGLMAPEQEDEEGLLITTNQPIEDADIININNKLKKKLKLPNEGYFVFLDSYPEGGFKYLLRSMQYYSENEYNVCELPKLERKNLSRFYDWIIGLATNASIVFSTYIIFGA